MIELEDVTKAYRTGSGMHVVLDHISFRIPTGTSLGILGGNGAGKSTLLRVVAGVEAPDYGAVRKAGRVSWPIGFGGGFNGSLSGEENCRFVARIYGEDVNRVAEFARSFAEIGEYFFMPVKTYSSGMRARLAFGLSMAIDFDVYLVDEVTAVGDAKFQKRCRQAFRARSDHSSVIMVSHQERTMRDYCDTFALLQHGRLEQFDSLGEALRARAAAA